jgi:acetyl esterase/lipase
MRHLLTAWAICMAVSAPAWAVAPFWDPIYGVSVTPDIVYGTAPINDGAGTADLVLDLYQPTDMGFPVPAGAPAIVLIHGGGFVGGNKSDMAPLAIAYVNYGYTVVSISYRLYGDLPPNSSPGPADNFTPPPPGFDTFPDLQLGANAINAAVQDGRTSLAWMQSHAATYGFDPARIGVGGVSAGAITSLLMGYNDPPPGLRPTAVLDFLGSMYGTEDVIQPGAPPGFIFHGTADTQVPFSGDQAVADQLTAAGVYREFYVAQGLGHVLGVATFSTVYGNQTLFEHNIDFLYNHLVVPEPASIVLCGCGCLTLLLIAHKRRRRARHAQAVGSTG